MQRLLIRIVPSYFIKIEQQIFTNTKYDIVFLLYIDLSAPSFLSTFEFINLISIFKTIRSFIHLSFPFLERILLLNIQFYEN